MPFVSQPYIQAAIQQAINFQPALRHAANFRSALQQATTFQPVVQKPANIYKSIMTPKSSSRSYKSFLGKNDLIGAADKFNNLNNVPLNAIKSKDKYSPTDVSYFTRK